MIGEWERWFAWKPVTLLTAEIAWLKFVSRRTCNYSTSYEDWAGDGTYQYAHKRFSEEKKGEVK